MDNPIIQIIIVVATILSLIMYAFKGINELNAKKRIVVLIFIMVIVIVFFNIESCCNEKEDNCNKEMVIGKWQAEEDEDAWLVFYDDGRFSDGVNKYIEYNDIKYNRYSVEQKNTNCKLILYGIDTPHDLMFDFVINGDSLYIENTQKYLRK